LVEEVEAGDFVGGRLWARQSMQTSSDKRRSSDGFISWFERLGVENVGVAVDLQTLCPLMTGRESGF
jgi:hypothetical protein